MRRALLSGVPKGHEKAFAPLIESGVWELFGTTGTEERFRTAGLHIESHHALTCSEDLLDGLVQTLDPTIHEAIRADPSIHSSIRYPLIDLLVVHLKPFNAAQGGSALLKDVDVGGPALILSGISNCKRVTLITDVSDYASIIELLCTGSKEVPEEKRRHLAAKAGHVLANRASTISNWLTSQNEKRLPVW